MGIGASIFMLAVGAILTFAFNVRVGWLDLDVVGWILMAAGAIGLIMTLTVFGAAPHGRHQHHTAGGSADRRSRTAGRGRVRPSPAI